MRAIILAAGQGTRLLPLTRDYPKCLVPVGGATILDHQLKAIAHAGIAEATIVGGYRIDRLEAHLSSYRGPLAIELLCNPFWPVANSISSVWTARARLTGDACILNGDTIFDGALVRNALARAAAGVSLLVEPTQDFEFDDMRVAVDGGIVRAVGKTLDRSAAAHRSLGFVVARGAGSAAYAAALERVICGEGGHARYHHAVVDHLAWEGAVVALESGGAGWAEIDRPEDIARWQGD